MYPVLSYAVVLKSNQTQRLVTLTVYTNETESILNTQVTLEDNQIYLYTVSAINSIGNVTTDENNLTCETACGLILSNELMQPY